MRLITSFLVSVMTTLVLDVRGQVFDCSEKIVQEFAFGGPFKADVEELINHRLSTEELCNDLSTYLWKEVESYCGLDMWQISDEATHKRIGGNIIQMLHYRANKAPATNRSDAAQRRIEDMFKLNLFAENVFETAGPSSCAVKVQQSLQLKQSFGAQLAGYFDGFDRSTCALFEKKIKATLSQTIGLSKVEWLKLPEQSKREAVEALFRLLYFASGAKLPSTATKADQVVAGLTHHELLRGDIFGIASAKQTISAGSNWSTGSVAGATATQASDKSAGNAWQMFFWVTLTVTAIIALYLCLRYIDAIPSIA